MTIDVDRNAELFDRWEALTFDDVVIVPGYSDVLPDTVDTSATFAADIVLNVPIVSAAMDKVTEARLAIALAREGGIGVIHRNLSVDEQAAEVQKVKRSQSGMITDPVTLPPTATLHDAEDLMSRFRFSGVPITDADGRLVGILTNRDTRFCSGADFDRPVTEFMTSSGLITAGEGTTLDEAKAILQKHRIEKLPLVDDEQRLIGLITVKDILKRQEFPNATRDDGRPAALRRGGRRRRRSRGAGRGARRPVVDAVAIDTAHGHSAGVIKAIERIKASWPSLPVVAGNVVTAEGVEALVDAGADAVKVGVGAGSICTTRVIAGAGMPQLSAIHTTAQRGPAPWRADHRRRRHHLQRRRRQGDRRRRGDGDARLDAGRHRRGARRAGAVRGPAVQELPRHGLARGDAGPRRRPLRQRPSPPRRQRRASSCPRASRAAWPTPARSATSSTSSSAACAAGWATPARPRSTPCATGARFMRVTTAGRDGEPPPRRDDHPRGPQLPTLRR